MSLVFSPRRRAFSSPGASALLEMTIAISAGSRPAPTDSAMASKFEPRPESKMPSFFNGVMRSGVQHLSLTFDDAPDQVGFFTALLDQALHPLELLSRNHQHHAYTHIEGPHHVVVRDIADLLHMVEYRQHRPGTCLHNGRGAFGQHAGQIVRNAAAGDVGHGIH